MGLQRVYQLFKKAEETLNTRALNLDECKVLKQALGSLKEEKWKRLKALEQQLNSALSLKGIMVFLVPLERVLNQKITDNDILITSKDKKKKKENPIVFVLDNLRSALNLGAILRTADAVGACAIWGTGYTPDPKDIKVKKTSMGAYEKIPFYWARDLTEVREKLGSAYEMVALETVPSSKVLYDVPLSKNTAFVFGNERFGLGEKDILICDKVVHLPMFGTKNSLNVGAAVSACAYEWVRQWSL